MPPTGELSPKQRKARQTSLGARMLRRAMQFSAALGLALTLYICGAAVADFSVFDETSGGYEPPYEGWSGTPIDWSIVDVSPTGFSRRGRVLDVLVDCTTGMITMDLIGLRIPFRQFSGRALAVHKPREACAAAGFTPAF